MNSSKQAAVSVVAEIQQLGRKAIAIEGNVANEVDANCLIESTISHFNRLDVLVNNAGVFTGSPVESVTTEDYRKTVGVNIDVTRAAVPHISENGTILNVSSIITKSSFPNVSVYVLTKAAVEGFTRALAVELAPRKTIVNAISPGYTDSDMLRGGGEGFVAAGIEASVFKRLGIPEDIAETAAFLAIPRSGAWVTGGNILSNGGAAGFSI
ncbi:UNVERIFIED_CONTAM: hypothetical protein HDU68_005614 [Siphonaria sp. JEL0065]|nr:hypothetical protein HDU68_005614 [Siphonaria sp. JEL0065]